MIAKRLGVEVSDIKSHGRRMLKCAYVDECSDSDHTAISLICELRECMNGERKLDGFNVDEMECILYNVCRE